MKPIMREVERNSEPSLLTSWSNPRDTETTRPTIPALHPTGRQARSQAQTPASRLSSTKIYYHQRMVGNIKNNIFYTTRKKEHYMVKYQGFGISKAVLDYLDNEGIMLIHIIYEGKRGVKEYECGIGKFLDSQQHHVFQDDDLQHFVQEKSMRRCLK